MIDFERQKGAKREAFGEAKSSQNQSQNDPKSKSIFKSEKTVFKTVLGASWGDLGAFLGPSRGHRMHSPCSGARFFEKSLFLKKVPSETDFKPTWAPKRLQKESKRHPKGHPKTIKKNIKKEAIFDRKRTPLTLKPGQQVNGKRRRSSIEQSRGRLQGPCSK